MSAFVASPVQKLAQPGWTGLFLVIPQEETGVRGSKRLKTVFGEEQPFFPQQNHPLQFFRSMLSGEEDRQGRSILQISSF